MKALSSGAFLASVKRGDEAEAMNYAAMMLQAAWRGKKARIEMQMQRNAAALLAVRRQSCFGGGGGGGGWPLRFRPCGWNECQMCGVVAQAGHAKHMADLEEQARVERELYESRCRYAASRIQAVFRGKQARKRYLQVGDVGLCA